jgi:hypothetical protein
VRKCALHQLDVSGAFGGFYERGAGFHASRVQSQRLRRWYYAQVMNLFKDVDAALLIHIGATFGTGVGLMNYSAISAEFEQR